MGMFLVEDLQFLYLAKIRFSRVTSYITDFNTQNKLWTSKLLNQGYRYHKVRQAFF